MSTSGLQSFKAHVAAGDYPALFNFVGPRSRKWSKRKRKLEERIEDTSDTKAEKQSAVKTAQPDERLNWDPWTVMAELGYPQEAMTGETGFQDPATYQRLMPLLQQYYDQDPNRQRAILEANALASGRVSDYMSKGGMPEDTGLFSLENLKRFFSPRGAAMDPARIQRLYDDVHSRIIQDLISKGVDEARAPAIAEQSLGSIDDFTKRIADQTYNSGNLGRTAIEDVAPWFWFHGAPVALGLKGLELGTSQTGRALFGDEQARQGLTQAMDARLRREALNNTTDLGLWDVAGGLGSGLLTHSIDEATPQVMAGLEKLRTGGTVQNRILMEHLQHQQDLERSRRATNMRSRPSLAAGGWSPGDIELEKQRYVDRVAGGRPGDREAFDRLEAAARNPYRNVSTLDFGGSTALESARSPMARVTHPSEWGGLVRDWITGSDTSHDYMMRAKDPGFEDDQGPGRFKAYQDANRRYQAGRFNPITDRLNIPVADQGKPILGGVFGLYAGQKGGVRPGMHRDAWNASGWIDRIRRGTVSQDDMRRIEENVRAEPGLAETIGFDDLRRDWNRNRWQGGRALQTGDDITKLSTKTSADRWAKTAGPSWYDRYEAGQTKDTGFSLQDYYKYQAALRKKYFRELMHGKITGYGMTPDEEAYGRGLQERWTKFGPGRYSLNFPGLVGRVLSTSDIQRLDPVLRKHREAIRGGKWRPGMQVDPLLQRNGFGWTNPIGGLSEFLGITPNLLKQERDLTSDIVKSKNYRKLRGDVRKGLLPLKDFYRATRGVNVGMVDSKDFADTLREGRLQGVRRGVRRLAELVKDTDKNLYTPPPLTAASSY